MKNTITMILNKKEKQIKYIDKVWNLLSNAYQKVKGGLLFKSKEELINTTVEWKVVIYKNNIVAVTVYKAKKGLKLVAMATNQEYREISLSSLGNIIKNDLKSCWMEISESAEKFVMRNGGEQYKINNELVPTILDKNIKLSADGFHYFRTIANLNKEKIIVGTPKFD